jgi:hypothetical protein
VVLKLVSRHGQQPDGLRAAESSCAFLVSHRRCPPDCVVIVSVSGDRISDGSLESFPAPSRSSVAAAVIADAVVTRVTAVAILLHPSGQPGPTTAIADK